MRSGSGGKDRQHSAIPRLVDVLEQRLVDRREFLRGILGEGKDGRPLVRKFPRDGSGLITSLREADGLIELEDVAAVRAWAVESGLADPERLVLSGASWGGYLTLLGLGTQPGDWAVGLAGVPVADYVASYDDEMEVLKALDRTLFGGSPEEVPDRFAAFSAASARSRSCSAT